MKTTVYTTNTTSDDNPLFDRKRNCYRGSKTRI